MKIKIEKRIHHGYEEFERAKKQGRKIPELFGKYQYIYISRKGEISLILLKDYFKKGKDFWEIYCLEGKLFPDTEKFYTKGEAERHIKDYLN